MNGLCQCGCKQPAPIAPQSSTRRGWVQGQPIRFIRGHNQARPADLRFWEYVNKGGPVPSHRPELGSCWIWTGGLRSGYGAFSESGRRANPRQVGAHCFAYRLLVGPIPHGLELDHLCRVRACCNPAHLEPVTSSENKRRSPLVGRHSNRDGQRVSAALRASGRLTCPNGHTWTEATAYRRPGDSEGRTCRPCNAEASARKRARIVERMAALSKADGAS